MKRAGDGDADDESYFDIEFVVRLKLTCHLAVMLLVLGSCCGRAGSANRSSGQLIGPIVSLRRFLPSTPAPYVEHRTEPLIRRPLPDAGNVHGVAEAPLFICMIHL